MIDRRLRRSAAALGDAGRDILDWLDKPAQRAALVRAAEDGLPSVAGISASFVARFGMGAGKTMVIRQFVGKAVRHVMEEEGYTPVDTGVKLSGDPVFSSGTRYQRDTGSSLNQAIFGLLDRILAALTDAELQQVEKFVVQWRRRAKTEGKAK